MEDTLHLSLKKQPFDLMVKGLKRFEYRVPSKWITSRLIGKTYKYIKFTNGYGSDKPWFIVEFNGFYQTQMMQRMSYPENFIVWTLPGDFVIMLGKVVQSGNLMQNAA